MWTELKIVLFYTRQRNDSETLELKFDGFRLGFVVVFNLRRAFRSFGYFFEKFQSFQPELVVLANGGGSGKNTLHKSGVRVPVGFPCSFPTRHYVFSVPELWLFFSRVSRVTVFYVLFFLLITILLFICFLLLLRVTCVVFVTWLLVGRRKHVLDGYCDQLVSPSPSTTL